MSSRLCSLVALSLLVVGCKRGEPPRSPDAVGAPGGEVDASETPGEAGAPETVPAAPVDPGAEPSTSAPAPSDEAPGPGVAPLPPGAERRGPPLPELRVKSFGLHVGGTARDAAARDDFLRALEKNSWRYLECYQEVEEPGVEGTFGADLRVASQGGKPTVSGVRTKLKGAEFRTCMERALESTKFDGTPSGRTVVVSYSLKFSFAW
jgi:hypothetical protein